MAKQLDKSRPAAVDKRKAPEPEPAAEDAPKKRGKLKLLIFILLPLLLVSGGGGAYFFLMSGPKAPSAPKEAAPAQPFFVEIKPFVVTVKAADGSMHYVQIALSLKVPNEEAVAAVDTIMPEEQDMIRQAVLRFKIDDLQTEDGVNKLRNAITGGSNRVFLQALGPQKIEKLGGTAGMLVRNVYFQNLVIE